STVCSYCDDRGRTVCAADSGAGARRRTRRGSRADGAAARGDGICVDIRWEIARGMGWGSRLLARGRRGVGGADDHGEAARAEYVSDLARRESGGFRTEIAV